MQSISRALGRLHEDASWFARAEGIELPPVEAARADVSSARAKLFRATGPDARVQPLLQAATGVAAALRDPYRGLVLVLAPATIDDATSFEAELEVLLQAFTLARCRLTGSGASSPTPAPARRGRRARRASPRASPCP